MPGPLRRLLRLVCLALVALPVCSRASDTAVTIAPELTARWSRPDAAWDGRAVLLLHGLASDCDDAGRLLKRLAESLAAQGIASLRINFRGEGDAARTAIESTLTTRLTDLENAHAWLTRQAGVDSTRIGALGFSLGSATAAQFVEKHPGALRSLAFWSSLSGDLATFLRTSELAEAAATAAREGIATREMPGWKTITQRHAFFTSFEGVNIDRALASHTGAFLTVRGTADYLPHRDEALVKAGRGCPAEALLIGGGDHIFNVFAPDGGQAQQVIDATAHWFSRTL